MIRWNTLRVKTCRALYLPLIPQFVLVLLSRILFRIPHLEPLKASALRGSRISSSAVVFCLEISGFSSMFFFLFLWLNCVRLKTILPQACVPWNWGMSVFPMISALIPLTARRCLTTVIIVEARSSLQSPRSCLSFFGSPFLFPFSSCRVRPLISPCCLTHGVSGLDLLSLI